MSYPSERKEAILKQRLAPNNRSIQDLAQEAGLSEATWYPWRKAARATGRWLPEGDTTPTGWNSADPFGAGVETAALNETPRST
jgi:transposase-like protein